MSAAKVELTKYDITALATAICEWHEDPADVGDYDVPCDACLVQARCTAGVYESMVADRVAAALRDAAFHIVIKRPIPLVGPGWLNRLADSYDPAPVNADPKTGGAE